MNLTTDDSYKQSESTVLTENMVRDRAARVLQRYFLAKFVRFQKRKTVVFKGYKGPKPAFCGTNKPINLIPDGKNLIGGDLPEVSNAVFERICSICFHAAALGISIGI